MELGLQNKVAIVTGASKGLGRAIAEELSAEGVHLALSARSRDTLDVLADGLAKSHNIRVLAVAGDLSTLPGVVRLAEKTLEEFGRLDILVNVAGAIRPGSLLSKPDADWLEDLNLKLFGYIRMMRAVFPIMQAGGGGRIVNIIGRAGREADPGYLAGSAANAALMSITKAVAVEGGPHGILVNGINPGPARTERYATINAHLAAEWQIPTAEVEVRRMQSNPLGRPCEPSEVAALAAFLVSERAAYLNGVIIEMDGGSTRCL
jgi:NAD(P)-dependent dehydrogenase (short-subunit alcohol dehydrogenase family)